MFWKACLSPQVSFGVFVNRTFVVGDNRRDSHSGDSYVVNLRPAFEQKGLTIGELAAYVLLFSRGNAMLV